MPSRAWDPFQGEPLGHSGNTQGSSIGSAQPSSNPDLKTGDTWVQLDSAGLPIQTPKPGIPLEKSGIPFEGNAGIPLEKPGIPVEGNPGIPLGNPGIPFEGNPGIPLGKPGIPLGNPGIPLTPGEPIGTVNQSELLGGVPLATAADWFDTVLGSGKAAVLQDVNINDFLSPTNKAEPIVAEVAPGLRTMSGEIMPIAQTKQQPTDPFSGSFGSIMDRISRRLKHTAG